MSNLQKQYALWDEFLGVWPASRLATMTLDDCTQAGSKDSFTYWIIAARRVGQHLRWLVIQVWRVLAQGHRRKNE